jgi:hypothetical protein
LDVKEQKQAISMPATGRLQEESDLDRHTVHIHEQQQCSDVLQRHSQINVSQNDRQHVSTDSTAAQQRPQFPHNSLRPGTGSSGHLKRVTDMHTSPSWCVSSPPQIQLEKRKVLLLEQQLEKMMGTLGTSRATMGGINHAKEKQQEAAKAIKLLENRLEQQYIKYNEVGWVGGCEGAVTGR